MEAHYAAAQEHLVKATVDEPILAKVERDTPMQGTAAAAADAFSLVCDERHDLLDKQNDQPCEDGERDSFIDACAAEHCYHELPPPSGNVLPD